MVVVPKREEGFEIDFLKAVEYYFFCDLRIRLDGKVYWSKMSFITP